MQPIHPIYATLKLRSDNLIGGHRLKRHHTTGHSRADILRIRAVEVLGLLRRLRESVVCSASVAVGGHDGVRRRHTTADHSTGETASVRLRQRLCDANCAAALCAIVCTSARGSIVTGLTAQEFNNTLYDNLDLLAQFRLNTQENHQYS